MIVRGNNLTMTRGDSESVTVAIEGYTPTSGDTLELTVRKRPSSPTVILHKVATEFDENGTATFYINPEDTDGLDFGDYVYDVQWTSADGVVYTIIKPAKFIIGEEVTYG